MIQQLLAGKHGTEAIASMRQYLERHQEQASFVRMMLVQALLAQNRPEAAIDALDSIPLQEVGAEQQSAISKIRTKAEAMHLKNLAEGVYEVDE
jgi:thioredoxin-like negative regulator of GroEL